MNRNILGPKKDILFIFFPFWIGVFYLSLVGIFPQYSNLIFIFFLCFFGETHFACTWLFFANKENKGFIKKNRLIFIYFPILILTVYFLLAYVDLTTAILLAGIASAIHVTRQSIGVGRLSGIKKDSVYEYCIYVFSGVGLLGGFLRFKSDLFAFDFSYWTELGCACIVFLIAMALYGLRQNLNQFCAFLTGSIIYLSYIFVDRPSDAIAIGVGMHWCQYLALTYKVYKNEFKFNNSIIIVVFSIFFYAIVMTFFETNGFLNVYQNSNITNYLLLVPLTGQVLHYWYDAFLWRFSNEHIKSTVGVRLFAK